MRTLLAAVLVLIMGCATNIYSSGYEMIQGIMITPPLLDKHSERITFYLRDYSGKTIVAIAENKDNFKLLKNLAHNIGFNQKPVYLFALQAGSEWREYVDSVDYEVYGVGYYDSYADRYVTVITTYGSKFTDVLRSTDWKSFITNVGKQAIKAVI